MEIVEIQWFNYLKIWIKRKARQIKINTSGNSINLRFLKLNNSGNNLRKKNQEIMEICKNEEIKEIQKILENSQIQKSEKK